MMCGISVTPAQEQTPINLKSSTPPSLKLAVNNIKAVLCTPAVIGEKTDFSNEQDGDLNKYSNIIRSIADKNNLPIIDLRKIFLDYNLKNNPSNKESGILTTDRVHLNAKGNRWLQKKC